MRHTPLHRTYPIRSQGRSTGQRLSRSPFLPQASKLGEEGKVALRNIRRDAVKAIEKAGKDGLSEDDVAAATEEMDKLVRPTAATCSAPVVAA